MKTIDITIAPDGATEIKTQGFAGRSCQDATRDLEKALGIVTSDTPTAERLQITTERTKLTQGN
jgi:hypothetical protein